MSLPGETGLGEDVVSASVLAQALVPLGAADWGALLLRVPVLGASALQLNTPLSSPAQAPDSVFIASAHLR